MPLCSTVVGHPCAGYGHGHCESGGWYNHDGDNMSLMLSHSPLFSPLCLFEIPVFGISSPAAHQLSGFAFSPLCMWCVPHCSNRRAFSPLVGTYCMPLGPYAVGDCCVTEFAKLTYIPCMLFFVFYLLPFIWKSISTPPCMRRTGCKCAATLTKEQ